MTTEKLTTEKLHWLRVIFQLRGSVIPVILPRVLLIGSFGLLVAFLQTRHLPVSVSMFGSLIPNVVFNLVLGLLLVFRTNTAYERFWEGRKCWETLTVSIRNLARHIQVAVPETDAKAQTEKVAALKLLAAFAIATKLYLREEPINQELSALLSPSQYSKLQQAKIPPLEISLWIAHYLHQQQVHNGLNMSQLTAMNHLLDGLGEALTGCERILKTPIPMAYAIHLKQLIVLYCLSLPFQLVNELSWWTGPTAAFTGFTLLGLEEIGIEIENPFGTDLNDLPLDGICSSLLQQIEDLTLPITLDAIPLHPLELMTPVEF